MRDYKKEAEWNKNHYTVIKAFINKNLGEKLKQKLKQENKTIANWITENAREYLDRVN